MLHPLRYCASIALLLSITALFSTNAFSAPYFNQPYECEQPDGSMVTVILNGDEYYIRAETVDGYTVIRDQDTKWYCYAELAQDGSEFISTGVPIGFDSDKAKSVDGYKSITTDIKVKKGLKLNDKARQKEIDKTQKELFGDIKVVNGLIQSEDDDKKNAGDIVINTKSGDSGILPAPSDYMPGTANVNDFNTTINGLVIIVDFPDYPAQYSLQQYIDKVKKPNAHYSNGNAASLRTYYEDVSSGTFIIDHIVYGIYRAPNTFEYYNTLGYGSSAQILMGEALNDMEANGFDFSQVSHYDNGEIKALCIMYTSGPMEWSKGLWWHASWWGGFSADGVHTGSYCTDDANNLNPGTMIHEHGHMAAKWPDTYSYVGGEPGTWGVMGGGYCDLPNPYFLYRNGWLTGENIMGNPGVKTMASADPFFAYFYYDTAQPTEFYIMKPYTRSLMFCPSLPDEGMTIWRINTQGDNAQFPNKDRYVELVHANNIDTQKNSNVCFKAGGLLDHFTTDTTPSSDWKYGTKATLPSGMDLTGISASGSTMTFTLGAPIVPTAYYPFNSSFADASGNGFTASGYNFPGSSQWLADSYTNTYFNLDKSLLFDGVDDYVVLPSTVAASNDLTITCWVKPQAVANMIPLDKFPADASGKGWSIRLTDDGKVAFLVGSQTNYTQAITRNQVYEANRWTNITCTYSSGTAKIYINGKIRMIKNSIGQSVNTSNVYPQLGIASTVNSEMIYNGLIDDVRFYDTVLETKALTSIDGLNFKPEKSMLVHLSLDETTGTLASDSSGHGYNGTLYNELTFDTNSTGGPVNNSLTFDGVDDYISIPPTGFRQVNNGMTFTLWVYPTAVNSWSRFFDFGNGSSADNIVIARESTSDNLILEVYNGGSSGGRVVAGGAIELNKWQFFAITISKAGNVNIYKDGTLIKNGNTAALLEIYRKNLYIGKSNWNADKYFQGNMDDIRIYNYNLTGTEITAIYESNRLDGPIPFNGDDNVSSEVLLEFEPATSALRHDIYFGTEYHAVLNASTISPEYIGRKISSKYNPPALSSWQEYFWRVDEIMPDGSIVTGPVWSFNTTGRIQRQVWTDIGTANPIINLTSNVNFPDNPSLVTELTTFEIPTNWAEGYGTKVHGLLSPTTTGNYRFWISGDDDVELWLSTNDNPANISLKAYIHNTNSNYRSYEQFSSQKSGLIYLIAGKQYYIMALQKEGIGGDHMAVAWQGPDSPNRSIIDGFWLDLPKQNEWPVFAIGTNPTIEAAEGISLTASLRILASDPDGDTLSYSRDSGPVWLSISNNGQIAGTPGDSDIGINTFNIAVQDNKGGFDYLPVSINVTDKYSGSLGMTDLEGMAVQWLNTSPSNPADLNDDDNVNISDFATLASQWYNTRIDGLVAHWTLDDSAGLIARDNYMHHNGELTNMVESCWVNGVSGNALSFDGNNDFVEIPGFKGIIGQQSRTCTAWVKTSKFDGQILNWGSTDVSAKWTIRINKDGALRAEVGGGAIYGTTNIADNNWHHIAVVLNNDGTPTINEVQLFVDGLLDTIGFASSRAIDTAAANNVTIGVFPQAPNYFKGLIDDVRIYNVPLSQEFISGVLYNDRECQLSFNETAGSFAYDSSRNKFIGTLKNGPVWQMAEGSYNGCLSFDGIDDYVEIKGFKGITGQQSRTCIARIKTDSNNSQIVSWGSTISGAKWTIKVNSDGILRTEVQGGYIYGTTNIADNNWHTVAVVMDNDGTPDVSEVKLYIDGQLEILGGVLEQAIDTSATTNVIVGAPFSNQSYFKGLIDDVIIYDRALTEAEIQMLN